MRKLTTALMASAVAISVATPARANNTERLLFGIGAAVIGEGIRAINNRQQPQPQQQPQHQQRQAPVPSQAASPSRPAASRPARVPDENVRFVQQQLHDLGYTEVGGADGFWGPNSARALGLFMADNGIKGDANVSPEIIAAIAKAPTRQEIADAKEAAITEAAIAETDMPEPWVEDGIVNFGPYPDPNDSVVAVDDVGDETVPTDDMEPQIEAVPPVQETVAVRKPDPDIAETVAAETETAPVDGAEAKEQSDESGTVEVAEKAEEAAAGTQDSGAREINGLTVSGDF